MARKKKEPKEIQNSLSEVTGPGIGGGFNPIGFPFNQGVPGTATVSGTGTVFRNLRWYFVSNMRQMLSEAYCEIGLIQTICDVPVDDALRGGVVIKSDQLNEDELKELSSSIDRDDDINTVGQAAKWNRLFGGAGIMIITDQDPAEPLDIEAIDADSELSFRAVDMWELFWDKQNTDGFDPASSNKEEFEQYSYYGERVHKSRVMRLNGLTAPSFLRPRLRGWGFSVVEILVRSINQYLKGTDLAFEVLDEFKIDIYKIKGFNTAMASAKGTDAIRRRLQLANQQKNYQNALVMDIEDEWDHKQLQFTGISDAMLQIRMQVAADMRMPITKLFGISAAGFNSGEDDIEVYNAMVESQVRNKIKYIILKLIEVKCKKLFGYIPDDITIEFEPLRVMSSEQEQTVKDSKFQRLVQAMQAGAITPEEFREACNKSQLFDISLEAKSADELRGYMDDTVDEEGDEGNEDNSDEVNGSRGEGNDPKPKEGKDASEGKKPKEGKAKEPKKAKDK